MNLKKNFCQWYYQYHDRSRPADKRRPDNNRQTIVYSNFIGFAKGNQHTYPRLTSSVFLQVVVLSLWLFIGAKSIMKKIKNCGKRKGIRDIWWNAFFVKDCRSRNCARGLFLFMGLPATNSSRTYKTRELW